MKRERKFGLVSMWCVCVCSSSMLFNQLPSMAVNPDHVIHKFKRKCTMSNAERCEKTYTQSCVNLWTMSQCHIMCNLGIEIICEATISDHVHVYLYR